MLQNKDSGKNSEKKERTKKAFVVSKRFGLILLGILLFLLVFLYIQNQYLVVSTYEYMNEAIPENLNGYRIVQISDLHNTNFGIGNKRLIHKIKKLNPDMIVITGDIVDGTHTDVSAAVSFVQAAVEMAPVYYVTGNHEHWLNKSDKERLFQGLKACGCVILANKYEKVDGFYIVGLLEENLRDKHLPKLMEEINSKEEDAFTVLLAHKPENFILYAENGVDLVFCGHAHGGQFILPYFGPVFSPDQGFWPKLVMGVHQKDDTTMVISRGLGNSSFPFRLFNYPEIVCVELKTTQK